MNIANEATARGISSGGLSCFALTVAIIALDSCRSIEPQDSADIIYTINTSST